MTPPSSASPASRGRGRLAFLLVFALCAAAALLPLWRARFLPLLDEPNHLSSAYIWHFFNDPEARLKEFYELKIQPVPFAAYYALVHLLAFATNIEAAHKIVLSAYVLSLPVAALLWARRTKRSAWLSILTFPLAYSYSWSYGFHPFAIGLATALFALIALDAFFERPRASLGLAVMLLALGCALSHVLALVTFFMGAPVLALASRPKWRRVAAAFALLTPAIALVFWQLFRSQTQIWSAPKSAGLAYQGYHAPVLEMLRELPTYTLDSVAGDADLWVFGVLAGAAALLFLSGLWTRRPGGVGGWRAALFANRGAALLGAMLACYLIVPLHLQRPFDWWFVGGRFATAICFFAFLLPAGPIRGLRLLLIAPAVAAALFLPIHISQRYVEFNQRAAPFVRLVERTRPGTDVLFLSMKPRGDPGLNVEAYNQFASWVQIVRGGFSGSGWFNLGFPFRAKRSLPGPPWYSHEQFNFATQSGPYEYILVHNERRPVLPPGQTTFRLVERDGDWTLYARVTEP